jgi:vanillate O-demethylase ferredoxin subunit
LNETVFTQQATVVGLRDLSPTVREITLRPDGGVTAFTVGSHLRVQVRLEGGRTDVRRYSLVGLPAPGADWRIAVKRADPGRGGSACMWRLAVGDRLPVHGPHNHFELPPAPRSTLLVAGGIGITPLLGMALALARRAAPLRMAYAARSAEELVYADELRAALGDRLATFCRSAGKALDLAAEFAALPADAQALVCGPVPLLHAARAAWARAGRLPQRLRFETFGNTGAAPAEAFTVQVPRHGLTLEVPAERSLLEVLQAAGVQVLHDCLRGECGLCAVDVLAVDGRIDHRDVFFSAAEQRAGRRLCACVSRVCAGAITIDSAWRPDELQAAA